MVIAIALLFIAVCCILYSNEDCSALYFHEKGTSTPEENSMSSEDNTAEQSEDVQSETVKAQDVLQDTDDLDALLRSSNPIEKD